jgi:hypothetical protein
LGRSDAPFKVVVQTDADVDDLKEIIKKKRENALVGVDADDLKLSKVRYSIMPRVRTHANS